MGSGRRRAITPSEATIRAVRALPLEARRLLALVVLRPPRSRPAGHTVCVVDAPASPVRCIEVTARTHDGPEQRWKVVAAVTEWSNGEGVDVHVHLGLHLTGHLSLTRDEAEGLIKALRLATGKEKRP